MKKSLVALAALAVVGAASAQSTVTLSGSLDAGLGRTTANNEGTSLTTIAPARNFVQIAGSEDLGGGLKASFGVQMRFNPSNGFNISNGSSNDLTKASSANDAFAQNVWVAVSGGFGEVKAGRFTGVVQGPIGNYDPFGTDSTGVSMTDPVTRNNGMIAYTSPTFAGFNVAIQSALKNNNTGAVVDTNAVQNGTEMVANYNAGQVSALLGYTQGLNKDKTLAIAASYDLGVAKPMAAYTTTDVAGDSNVGTRKQFAIGATAPFGATLVKAGYRVTKATAANVAAENINRFSLGANYSLSKRTTLVADLYRETQTGTEFQTGYFLGARHSF